MLKKEACGTWFVDGAHIYVIASNNLEETSPPARKGNTSFNPCHLQFLNICV